MSGKYILGEAGARKLRELLNAGASKTAARRTPHLELEDNFALPFTVQWAQSVGDSGAWIIWLPEIDHLVMFQGSAAPIGDSLEAAGGDYPEGWYILPEEALSRESGGSLILTIIPGETAGASFAGRSQTSEDGETWAIKICEALVDSESGARAVKQLVTSAIHLGELAPSPFQYVKSVERNDLENEHVTHKITNNVFYWNGVLQEIADFDVSALMDGGTVWLVGKQTVATASTPEPDWEWSLAAAEGTAPYGGKVLNYKLYDFAQSAVACDYRTTFLALEDHTQKAKVEIAKSATATSKVVLDAAGDNAKVVVSDAEGYTITLDPADHRDADCSSQNIGVHQLICPSGDPEDDADRVYHVLSCSDIDLRNLKGLLDKNVVMDVSFSLSNGQLVATLSKENLKTGEMSQDVKTVCTLAELVVVTSESYTSNQFKNVRKRVKVFGEPTAAAGETVFTTTPHSAEA